jgi:hypothetical protein
VPRTHAPSPTKQESAHERSAILTLVRSDTDLSARPDYCFAVLLMTGAVVGDRIGRRRVLIAGLGLFATASAARALAPDAGWLIAARRPGCRGGARDTGGAGAGERGLLSPAPRTGTRDLQRRHRVRRALRPGRRRRDHRRDRVAVDLLAQRSDRGHRDRAPARPRRGKLWRTRGPGSTGCRACHGRRARPYLGARARQHGRLGKRRSDRRARRWDAADDRIRLLGAPCPPTDAPDLLLPAPVRSPPATR